MTASTLLDCVVLAGGKGTRLASIVSDVPKPLAPVAGRPFLDYVLAGLAASGAVRRAVLALGHMAAKVIDHYDRHPAPLPLRFVIEPEPLGTGGALRHALDVVDGDIFFAVNGDSIAAIDWPALLAQHRRNGAAATLVLVAVPDAARFGSVVLEGERVVRFAEKQPGAGLVNAGIYVVSRALLASIPPGPCSFERDILPEWAAKGQVAGMITDEPFLDIGLPETYAAAPAFLAK